MSSARQNLRTVTRKKPSFSLSSKVWVVIFGQAAKEAELQAIEEEIVTRRAELEVLLVDYGEATNKEFELNTK